MIDSSKKNRGFTLIELLVVISIIALLSSVVLASLNSARSKARDSERLQSMIQLRNAIELYRLDNNGVAPGELFIKQNPGSFGFWQVVGGVEAEDIIYNGTDNPLNFRSSLVPKYIGDLPKESMSFRGQGKGYLIPSNLGDAPICGGGGSFNYILYFAVENDNTALPNFSYSGTSYNGTGGNPLVKCIGVKN